MGFFNAGGGVERVVSIGIKLGLHNAVRLRIRKRHARCSRRPIVFGSEQSKQRHYDWIAGVWATAAIKSDTRHELAAPRREPLPPGTQLLVISGDINCSPAAVRKPEYGDPVGSDVGSSGEQVGCGEHVLRALASPIYARGKYISVTLIELVTFWLQSAAAVMGIAAAAAGFSGRDRVGAGG